ncbi:MAG: DNA polymerase IV [Deltaproteobacteria bacterium]|nr:DNA polymerase IV [Deltaproteobacteria bacterium]MBW2130669.1 DNA polymerase IV [Deltaproteobacteria bacterium]MBW2305182.1 DNA polymerase IV [Deltaproteobacteria bacterium]
MRGQLKAKVFIHLDMDAFYPSVEVLDNPALKGKPVIVGGSRERGVVSSASYEARKFGVHSAQPMATAMRLCPHGIFLPVRMARYKEVSEQVFEIFYRFTPLVEPLSIDEAFLDVTGSTRLFGRPGDIAKKIKKTVLEETGLTVSAGVASSKFVAKIASDMDKPDGLTIVPPDRVREFLNPLPIKKMWGVGKVMQQALMRLNVRTFRDLSQVPLKVLEKEFGKRGLMLHQLSMGIDDREVIPDHEMKSIGHEETFSQDILDMNTAKKKLLYLANKVAYRMRKKEAAGKTVTLKVKYSDFRQVTRSKTLPKSTDDGFEIYSIVCRLLEKTAVGKRPVRLLGISLSQLSFLGAEHQLTLFDQDADSLKRKNLNIALDSLYEKYGEENIKPGVLFDE